MADDKKDEGLIPVALRSPLAAVGSLLVLFLLFKSTIGADQPSRRK